MNFFHVNVEDRPRLIKAIISLLSAGVIYYLLGPHMAEAERRMSFIFVMAALFWAMEIMPLYATSLLVVLLEILLLARPGGVLGMDQGGYQKFLIPFSSPVIILFFGSFVLARAMEKYQLDRLIVLKMIQYCGNNHFTLLFGFMAVTTFLSMWMSNTATAAMMMPMVVPLLKQIDADDEFRTALVLAIPFAANIGGMATPIGSPPNAIAIGALAEQGMHLSFIGWMKMAVPFVAILMVAITFLLYYSFPPKAKELRFELKVEKEMSGKSVWALVIVVVTILLWLSSEFHKIPVAVIGLLAAVLFSIGGLLNRNDFNTIEWDVLILMWGGLALGEGMEISGLTQFIVGLPIFEQSGFFLVAIFCLLTILLSTFMSNTATANLVIPVVMVIPGESKVLLAITAALSCSLAMAMPISTPPNAIAYSTDMLKTKDMLKMGVIIAVISLVIILSGFKLVITKAFGLQ